ncbi:MAG: FAD-binding oxidoreductase [Fimbriimonadaceae bacterium]|nr:FAD-binding oxidoreductase [Fimbriimonadaceae bacterium]
MAQPDCLVVGAGVVGLATAYELATTGRQVLVLDRGRVGAGASGVGGGFVTQVGQRGKLALALVRESQRRYLQLGERLAGDIGLRQCGCLVAAADSSEAAALDRVAADLATAGSPGELLDAASVRRVEPALAPSVVRGLAMPEDLQIEPARLLATYRQALRRLGSEVREQRLVTGLRRSGERVVGVRTRYGDLDAGEVVLCAGCWTAALLPPSYASIIRPRRGQVLLGRLRRRCLQGLVLGVDYLSSKSGGPVVGCSVEQNVDGLVRLGGSREWVGFNELPTAAAAAILANAGRYLRLPEDLEWQFAAAALRPATPDGLPLLGAVEPGLWIHGGHEGSGFAMSPATAQRLAALIGRQPVDLRGLLPSRFMTPPQAVPHGD